LKGRDYVILSLTYFHFSEATLEIILRAKTNYPQKKKLFPFFMGKATLCYVVYILRASLNKKLKTKRNNK
jgi:hypothetical protein